MSAAAAGLLPDGPGRADEAAPPSPPLVRLAFVAHTGGRIALRPVAGVPAAGAGPPLPRELAPGDRLGDLAFAELAAAFRGVVGLDPATGEARILDTAPPGGAPRRLAFAVDGRGVVALRGLDGHPWSEDVPPGRPVFGLAPAALRGVREGVLELDPERLEARLVASAGAAVEEEAAADAAGRRRRRLLPAAVGLVLLLLAAGAGSPGWWWRSTRPEPPAAAAGLADPAPATPAPEAPEAPASPPALPGPPPDDPLDELEALAGSAGEPGLAARLEAIAAALREERGRAAAAAVEAGAQLARAYRRDAADVGRLETALGVCGGDAGCRERYAPALARAAAGRDLTGDAYVELLDQAARDHPQALLEARLAEIEARQGGRAAAGGTDGLARRFVGQAARWRDQGTAAAAGGDERRAAVVAELLAAGGGPGTTEVPAAPGGEDAEP